MVISMVAECAEALPSAVPSNLEISAGWTAGCCAPGQRPGQASAASVLVRSRGASSRSGTPGIPAAAPASRTGHQTGPHAPPAGPALQDKADVASSHTPERVTPLLRCIPQIPPKVNKLPLGVNPIRPKMRGLFACWRNACIDAIKADPEEKLGIPAGLYLGISSFPPFWAATDAWRSS
jgi:hypothetical protein